MTLRRVIGVFLILVGAVATMVYAMALLDPAGTQLADDGDPFGPPPSAWFGVIGLFVSLVAVVAGAWLTFHRSPAAGDSSNSQPR